MRLGGPVRAPAAEEEDEDEEDDKDDDEEGEEEGEVEGMSRRGTDAVNDDKCADVCNGGGGGGVTRPSK